MLRAEYLSQKLTPYPLPTLDGGVLRTIGNARAYMLALPKKREQRSHWQHACRLLLQEAGVAALTRQVRLALFMDGKLDAGAFEHMSSASPCAQAPGSWKIAAADLWVCDVAPRVSLPEADALSATDAGRWRAPHHWQRPSLHAGAAEEARAALPLATRLSATPARSRCGGVDPAGSPRAIYGRQA